MPIHRVFTIRYRNFLKEQVSATLYNPAGKAVCTSGLINAEALNGKQVLVNQFAGGLYYLKIVNSNGVVVGNMKIVVAK